MNIEKLFGSKTKCDILKYLLFRRQGVSMRALEAELGWTFPAIKKQIESLQEANILSIDKNDAKWAVHINDTTYPVLHNLFLHSIKQDIVGLCNEHEFVIKEHYLGKIFGYDIETDLVIVHQNCEAPLLDEIKRQISDIFYNYKVENIRLTFLSTNDRQKRYQLADRFVLAVIRVHS